MATRLTCAEYDKCVMDDKVIKISYLTHCGRGELIMKQSFYDIRQKKIEKLLKGLTYWEEQL